MAGWERHCVNLKATEEKRGAGSREEERVVVELEEGAAEKEQTTEDQNEEDNREGLPEGFDRSRRIQGKYAEESEGFGHTGVKPT